MPVAVAVAATLQLLLAATFFVLPLAVLVYGDAVQRAAEAEVVHQGFPAEILAAHGIRFKERAWEFALANAIAVALTALAVLNFAGNRAGQILSWIAEPVVWIAAGSVTAGQVFAARYTVAAFARSKDTTARDLDAQAVITVASDAFPIWLRPTVFMRFVLVILGSPLVILLLLTSSANAYFH
ncbi:hypothetical protein AB0M12_05365 [Nocardia vinacea]|uniref:hypothetical protein n=1 Tax=Nocardia vinacea TaxID=96468 RepID=UPI00343412FD